MTIELSTTSQDLIKKLIESDSKQTSLLHNITTTIERQVLIQWIKQTSNTQTSDKAFFLIASLQASLLDDLNKSLSPAGEKEDDSTSADASARLKYGLLALAGTVYFGCEGFDGVTAFMGIFSSIPSAVIFAAGTLFSILSIIVFYSFDLVEISKNLKIKSSETPQLLDILLEQFKQIKALRERLGKISGKTKDELQADLDLLRMLAQRHQDLKAARDELHAALDNPYLKAGKYLTAGVAGLIFFNGGFFAGKSVALAIAGIFFASMSATAWPIVVGSIGFGFVVGLAALGVYWFVERPGIENLISRWRGLDKKKIDKLCKSDVVDEESANLEKAIADLNTGISHLVRIEELEKKASRFDELETNASRVPDLEKDVSRLKGELILEKQAASSKKEPHLSPLQRFSRFRRTQSEGNLLELDNFHPMEDKPSSSALSNV
ncbi:hypothetical protein OQJ26_01080 [Legionella sp. PATHC038]|uniref:hypothetical protein n=1 Tax=Legionella sheltonii TaxID=2992041 RepID=UPI002244CF89|nr:hypothetical protein [Legionella sp. PATHC038]MCW8397387.1 hypothetical protein [Legionella sp. PATHC038]